MDGKNELREQVLRDLVAYFDDIEAWNDYFMKPMNEIFKNNEINIKIDVSDSRRFRITIGKKQRITDEILCMFIMEFYKLQLDVHGKRTTIDEINSILSSTNYIRMVSIDDTVEIVEINNVLCRYNNEGNVAERKRKPKSKILNIITKSLDPKDADAGYTKGQFYYNWQIVAPKKKYKLTDIITIKIDGKQVGEATIKQLTGKGFNYSEKRTSKDWHFDIFDLNSLDGNEDGDLTIKGKYAHFKYFSVTVWSHADHYATQD